MLTDTRKSVNAKVHPVDGLDVEWTGGLWKERSDTCARETVPQLQHMFESKDISHVVENFRICAGETEGEFDGTVFGDGDFYKWMEAAIYAAAKTGNQELAEKIDGYVDLIARAQQPDGYLSTKQIIGERQGNGTARMGDINDFEVYNFGHMFTAACLHKRITGKDSFMAVAVKTADYLEHLYEEAMASGEVQTAVCPSHYMGLVEMYRTTGEERYLALAKQAIGLRDSVKNGLDDNQDRIPLKEHDRILGHAVRANYLYAGVADLCLEETDEAYREVLHKVWRSLTEKKIYITGGCGALYNGVSPYGNFFTDQKIHQAYGYEYQLPNITAYNETCASLGGVFWAYRMFQLEPEAEYFDMIERMMLNTNLAALSMDGKRFFYENMLRRTKELDYKLIWPLTRSEYILSYCCPPNLARTVAQSGEYAYTVSADTVWLGMYGANRAKICLENGAEFTLVQQTDYPFDGKIRFTCENVKSDKGFLLNLRIPGWAESGKIRVNGEWHALGKAEAGTYRTVEVREPRQADILLELDMKVRCTTAHNMVEEACGQAAVERGPLVYCCEGVDTEAETLDDLYLDLEAEYRPTPFQIGGRPVTALETETYCMNREGYDRNALYQTLTYCGMTKEKVRFIPYYAWDNREFGEMRVWFPVAYGACGTEKETAEKAEEKTEKEATEKEKTEKGTEGEKAEKRRPEPKETEKERTKKEAVSKEGADFPHKIIVLDDDPTGVQTVHDISVYTDWEEDSIRRGFEEENGMFFILTNSRSFSKEKTETVHREIARRVSRISKETGKEFLLISRGDSTLRGHYPLETETLRKELEQETGKQIDGEIICPFFPEGGRLTIGNVHYAKDGNMLVPVGMTEFARDKTFGYHASDLTEYIEEKTQGAYKKEDCISIDLEELRENRKEDIYRKLISAHNFAKIIVNATSYKELDVFREAFIKAVQEGKHYLARTAAAFPKTIGGVTDRPLLSREEILGLSDRQQPESETDKDLPAKPRNGGIVLVGSHVQKTTAQLEDLMMSKKNLAYIEFDVNTCSQPDGLEKEAKRAAAAAEKAIKEGKTAVVYTSRKLLIPDTEDPDRILQISVDISDAVTSVISRLCTKPAFIIAKGGITSSDVGTKALGVKKAVVMGQIRKGIPVWRTGKESKFPGMAYIIFPGNVGEKETLRQIVEELTL